MTTVHVEGGNLVRKHMLVLPVLVVLLAGSTAGTSAQGEAGPDGLVTEEVEPGVERIIRDDAGHDLDEKHPTYRYDMDHLAIAPDGTVWLSTSYSRSDNQANAATGSPGVWALGRPGSYPVRYENPPVEGTTYLYVGSDEAESSLVTVEAMRSEALEIPVLGGEPRGRPTESVGAGIVVARPDGDHTCQNLGLAVKCLDPARRETFYLVGTSINQIAAAPDGTLWVVGGYAGDNGGLYRITLD
jgi:hypothetical protein